MSKQKLRVKVKIEGREAGVVAAITPTIDVPEVFGTRGACAGSGVHQWISISFVAAADGRLPHDAGESNFARRCWSETW